MPLGSFEFFSLFLIVLVAAFFYPKELFWFFVFLLPFESVVVSPEIVPVSMRPYQVVGFALIIATIIKIFNFQFSPLQRDPAKAVAIFKQFSISKFLNRKIIIFFLPIFAFLALANSPDKALSAKQALVLTSFVVLFWMAGYYLKTNKQKFEALWFFLASSKIVIVFGLYQAVAYKLGLWHMEVMPGRINSTFTEPDWLGMYLVFILALVLWVKFAIRNGWKENVMLGKHNLDSLLTWLLNIYLVLIFVGLILTVARSAWVAAIAVLGVYFLFKFLWVIKGQSGETQKISSKLKTASADFVAIVLAGIISAAAIFVFGLSDFHFFNRAASSVSGLQKITISCDVHSSIANGQQIQSTGELSQYGCRHINLEEIQTERIKGNFVKEVYRPDPNVDIRKNIYKTVWQQIMKHPILGQGIGTSSLVLGQDELGHGFNASNIFLETWLSMGIGGLLVLLFIFIYPLYRAFSSLDFSQKNSYNYTLFFLLTTTALIVPNMFNSGLFLGYFWVWVALIF